MTIVGVMRVRNEARFITRAIRSLTPFCDELLVLDDFSEDGTPEICEAEGAMVRRSPFEDLDEARDKDLLLAWAYERMADWCFMLDGDEFLEPNCGEKLRAMASEGPDTYSFPFIYLWDREDQIRVDGVYGRMRRQCYWRMAPGQRFARTPYAGNFHCGSVPESMQGRSVRSDIRIFHAGYLHRADRIRKFNWYRQTDPGNYDEGEYLHVAQGDIPDVPATARLKHAGPLELRNL